MMKYATPGPLSWGNDLGYWRWFIFNVSELDCVDVVVIVVKRGILQLFTRFNSRLIVVVTSFLWQSRPGSEVTNACTMCTPVWFQIFSVAVCLIQKLTQCIVSFLHEIYKVYISYIVSVAFHYSFLGLIGLSFWNCFIFGCFFLL